MGVNGFLAGLCVDLYGRCQRLLLYSKVVSPYPELSSFSSTIYTKLQQLKERIVDLQDSDIIRDQRFWRNAYEEYQDISSEVSLLEQFAIPVLIRYNASDHLQNRWVTLFAREIGYPQELLPIVTTTSNQYYWAKPELQLIAMPIGDVGGILGWPDLVHEMAHILLEYWPDFLAEFRPHVKQYFDKKRQSIIDLNSNENDNKWLIEARLKWGDRHEGLWQIEMAANLIATFVLGSSFGWQHVRLSINHTHGPYAPSPSDPIEDHPADQAQLDCISEMLTLMRLQDESNKLRSQWDEILNRMPVEYPQGYSLYYPSELLKGIAEVVFNSCKAHGLICFTDQPKKRQNMTILNLIDQAWHQFRISSQDYSTWEVNALKDLEYHLDDIL